MNCPSSIKHPNGRTATGTTPHPERTVACDRSLKGKRLVIHGIGERTCEDTGGAITAGRIDLYLPTIKEALAFGKQQHSYQVIE